MSQAKKLTDHQAIRSWAEERGGRPARVEGSKGDGGILRFDFGDKDEGLQEISWEEFFAIFEDRKLALLEQDETSQGKTSRFSKFVSR
jgi:hypothetical protein